MSIHYICWERYSDVTGRSTKYYDIIDFPAMTITADSNEEPPDNIYEVQTDLDMIPLANIQNHNFVWDNILEGKILVTGENVEEYITANYPEILL